MSVQRALAQDPRFAESSDTSWGQAGWSVGCGNCFQQGPERRADLERGPYCVVTGVDVDVYPPVLVLAASSSSNAQGQFAVICLGDESTELVQRDCDRQSSSRAACSNRLTFCVASGSLSRKHGGTGLQRVHPLRNTLGRARNQSTKPHRTRPARCRADDNVGSLRSRMAPFARSPQIEQE